MDIKYLDWVQSFKNFRLQLDHFIMVGSLESLLLAFPPEGSGLFLHRRKLATAPQKNSSSAGSKCQRSQYSRQWCPSWYTYTPWETPPPFVPQWREKTWHPTRRQWRARLQCDWSPFSASLTTEILSPVLRFRIRIRIHRIHMFLGLLDPEPLVRGMDPHPDPAPDLDPSTPKQK